MKYLLETIPNNIMASKTAQKAKFRAAAKSCKGKKITPFRACMRAKLKK